ncbi:hypothetical protein [Streptomyces sp. V4I2]|uniref:hypothetical protein n=1 Tax=Streptomyces sp. V4I2 TaxID=3042280 RepID=UPI0027D8C922|nr:hypothetical protein [Streptomyces sp. V4I2]
MDSDEVHAALGGPRAGNSQVAADGGYWMRYQDIGVTGIYGPGMLLVGVAIDAMEGPLVRLQEVELIARVPSQARAEIDDLARREGAAVRVNWSGDPEIAAWGVSMGTALEYGLSTEGHPERKDRMITSALFVSAELAEAPYEAVPVRHWCDVREREKNSVSWPVKTDEERSHWDWSPQQAIGPLQFGMTPQQVADALGGEVPAGRQGHFPYWWRRSGAAGQWTLTDDRFEQTGVSAHYSYPKGLPVLGAVTVHGRTGPQITYAGIHLIGATPSRLDAAMLQHIEDHDLGLLFTPSGSLVPSGLQMDINVTRAGDTAISEVTFASADWEL